MADHRHRDNVIVTVEPDAPNTGGFTAVEDTNIRGAEADRTTGVGEQHHVVIFGTDTRIDQFDRAVLWQFHRDLAVAADIGEVRQAVAPHVTCAGGKDHLQFFPIFVRHIDRHDRCNGHTCGDRQDIHDRLALGGAATLRQTPGLELVDHPIGGEEQ